MLDVFNSKKRLIFLFLYSVIFFAILYVAQMDDNNYLPQDNINKELIIGGLDAEIEKIKEYVLSTRSVDKDIQQSLGIKHNKGIILYGPPGTGKTLVARYLGQIINCKNIQIINANELLDCHYGVTEQRIKAIFDKAEYKPDELHLIIFDEIDALFPRRRGERDSFKKGHVNQMLSCMDGIKTRNNIIVFGLTNYLENLDEALIRSGRFGLHIKIDIPNAKQRADIIRVYTTKIMRTPGIIMEVDIEKIVDLTNKFTGADIESMFNLVYSKAFRRSARMKTKEHYILLKDFMNAIIELKKVPKEIQAPFEYDSEDEIDKIKSKRKQEQMHSMIV